MTVPDHPKIYHIVHVDRLPSIVNDERLWCDRAMEARDDPSGTTIGMSHIKQRRLQSPLDSRPSLHVGQCVPFYFCPRSIMLYLLYQSNHPDLDYRGGQGPIVHLEADLHATVAWAENNKLRWAFTLSNAGSEYFEDRADLTKLNEIDWTAVGATDWRKHRDGKQAEFLIEHHFPWSLVSRIAVQSPALGSKVSRILRSSKHRPPVEHLPDWYY